MNVEDDIFSQVPHHLAEYLSDAVWRTYYDDPFAPVNFAVNSAGAECLAAVQNAVSR